MKIRIIALLLAGCICLSLAACGEDEARSVTENADAADTAAVSGEEDEEYELEIPDAVKNISPEDDKAVTGVLTEDSYTNEYFGFKLNRIEGGTILSLMDEGTDLMPLSETYNEGIGSIYIKNQNIDNGESVSATISALTSKQQGKTENDLAQERLKTEQGLNGEMGLEAECSVENITVAGEEHPAYVEIYERDEGGMSKNASLYIIKNDFLCCMTINADSDKFDELLKLIEGI